jgi:hypothetical protein
MSYGNPPALVCVLAETEEEAVALADGRVREKVDGEVDAPVSVQVEDLDDLSDKVGVLSSLVVGFGSLDRPEPGLATRIGHTNDETPALAGVPRWAILGSNQ